jgi:CheY-like chemotaxis protein
MLIIVIMSLLLVLTLVSVSLFIGYKKREYASALNHINNIIDNKSIFTESIAQSIIHSKNSLLTDIGKFSRHSSVALANDIRLLHDKLKSINLLDNDIGVLSFHLLESADSMSRYFREINNILKYEEGILVTNIDKYDMKHFLQIIAKAYQLKYASRKHISVQYNTVQSIDFDPFTIEQLLDNIFHSILTNSSDASVTICVESYKLKFWTEILDAIWISVKIKDHTASPENDLENLLENSISKLTKDSHYAKMWIDNNHQDSSFNIVLPVSALTKGKNYKSLSSRFFEKKIFQRLCEENFSLTTILRWYQNFTNFTNLVKKQKRILLVDDNDAMLEYAKLTLPFFGCLVDSAHSHRDAFIMISEYAKKYDLIILDMSIADIDNELIYSIYQLCQTNKIKIVFQLGDMSDAYRTMLDRDGCYLVLKPYSFEVIESIIAKI